MHVRFPVKTSQSKMATMENAVVSSMCSPHKAVPRFMINDVLTVCPDVDPKDVAKDLVITGSATRTINRILDGQFPAAVNIDIEDTQSELSSQNEAKNPLDSLLSKDSMISANIRSIESNDCDSSDTEKYSHTDDDVDDIMIRHEERKSLFSALKDRMLVKETAQNCRESSKPLGMHTDRGMLNCKESNNKTKKTPVKTKRRSSIVDLSFSDDDDDDETDPCASKKTDCKINTHSSSSEARTFSQAADCILVESHKSQNYKAMYQKKSKDVSKLECFSKLGTKLVDSSPYDNDTDSCEDSDDFPCMLPSTSSFSSQIESSSQSCTPSLSSGSCLDSQDSSEIPVKKKKRSAEEIMRQKNEALQKKEAKQREKQARKEAKEKEKQARQQAREQMKAQKDKEKLLKKANSMNQKLNNRLDSCIKQIVVYIDPDVLTSGQLPEESILLQKLESLGASHRVESQLIPASITWQRGLVEHDVEETLQISTKTTFTDEHHIVLRLTAIKFVEMVFQFREEMQNPVLSVIADDETLCAFCKRTLDILPEDKVITLVIMGLEKYFRDVKLTQQRQFRSAVIGPSSSDTEKPSGKGRKKANKESGPSIMVSRVDVEEALVDLQLRQPNCRVCMCETEEEFVELLAMFTKAVAEAPFKKKQPETFSFCVEGGEKASVKVSKEGEGLKKVWQQHFQQFRNVSADMAAAIVAVYPTPQSLLQAYKQCESREEAAKLLQDILVRRGAGVLATSRRIGPELSRRVHMLLTSEDGDLSMK